MGANLFLVAAPRAGSTQLAHWISSHPKVGLCPVKEPNFFSAHEIPEDFVRQTHLNDVDPATYDPHKHRPTQFAVFREKTAYQRLFEPLKTTWRLDASTSYLSCPEAPAAMYAFDPNARVILLTRDPVDRALSHYRLAIRTGRTQFPLAVELEKEVRGEVPLPARFLLRPSRQKAGLARFKASFPPAQILALTFDEVTTKPDTALSRIAHFLDLDPAGFNLSVEARNAGAAPRFSSLNRLLLRTGIKAVIRKHLPYVLKKQLKPLWFDHRRPINISPAEIAALGNQLVDEV